MATRDGRPFAADPLDGVVRSLYSAGLALVGVGFVGGVLAWTSVLEATGSVTRSTAMATNALGGSVLGTGTDAVVVHASAIAVAAGVWLLAVGLVVDGFLDA
ncbi:hypothetical protein [Halorubellus litoreus]|uniref:Uncharacterized protein n=1 Tax=Halorubellus litoreus TaxID=755308 RepID=A0ABD5VIH8_9EURY